MKFSPWLWSRRAEGRMWRIKIWRYFSFAKMPFPPKASTPYQEKHSHTIIFFFKVPWRHWVESCSLRRYQNVFNWQRSTNGDSSDQTTFFIALLSNEDIIGGPNTALQIESCLRRFTWHTCGLLVFGNFF